MAKISVIVPVYNTRKDYFEKCIESIQKQTMKELEIIIVNDGSNKEIENLCNQYNENDNRIKVIHQNQHIVNIINI